MIELVGNTAVSDMILLRGIEAEHLQERINAELAGSLARELMKNNEFRSTIVKRDDHFGNPFAGQTVYETRVLIMTPEEYREFKELKEFKRQMKNFIK